MRKAIVNVSTGAYADGGRRLVNMMQEFSRGAKIFAWIDKLPPNSPDHYDVPYAFKAYGIMAAIYDEDPELILWADASVVPIRDLAPLWDRIAQEGYWIAKNGWTNYEWTADAAYADLFPRMDIDEARAINKTFPQVVATSFGLNLRHPIGAKFLSEYFRLAQTRAFCGPWTNTNNPKAVIDWAQAASRMGPCGPPDVIGHRHDQTAASVIAWQLGMKLTDCPEVLSYPPPHDNTILLVRGA
jgi:hypothetical protein